MGSSYSKIKWYCCTRRRISFLTIFTQKILCLRKIAKEWRGKCDITCHARIWHMFSLFLFYEVFPRYIITWKSIYEDLWWTERWRIVYFCVFWDNCCLFFTSLCKPKKYQHHTKKTYKNNNAEYEMFFIHFWYRTLKNAPPYITINVIIPTL